MTTAAYAARFPRIPGVLSPRGNLEPPRLDLGPRFESEGIIDKQPPLLGAAFVTLVPASDADGNDLAGIRLPEVAVPLGTYTGWNLRPAAMGAHGQLSRWSGSYFPFAATAAERRKAGDPRASIEERYSTRADYVRRVEASADGLRQQGYLLEEDARALVETARGLPWPPVIQ